MSRHRLIASLLLVSTAAVAYQDNDIDGVDDSIDRCLNTPFVELVDEHGCTYGKSYLGAFTLKVGGDIRFDTFSKKTTDFNFYANYQYNHWDLSLSNSNYTTYDTISNASSNAGDLYLSGGYLFKEKTFNTKLTIGTKLATADEDVGTGENDFFASVNFDYFINDRQNIFLYYGYTLSGDSNEIDYDNFHSYSMGSGYALNDKWYTAFSYDYSGSIYSDGEAYRALSWFNSYEFSKQFFATINYAHGLDDLSPDHTLSLKFGVRFE